MTHPSATKRFYKLRKETDSMNKETFLHVPENVAALESAKSKFIRQDEHKQNRDVSHMLKSGANDRHLTKRSMPHVRGR